MLHLFQAEYLILPTLGFFILASELGEAVRAKMMLLAQIRTVRCSLHCRQALSDEHGVTSSIIQALD